MLACWPFLLAVPLVDSFFYRLRWVHGLLCLLLLLGVQQPAYAQESLPGDGPVRLPDWTITTADERVTLAWQSIDPNRTRQSQWPLADINGFLDTDMTADVLYWC